jgi:hypothetical protein
VASVTQQQVGDDQVMPREERLPLSEDEKVAGLRTIGYEVWMMGQCARMLTNGGLDEVVHNTVVESELLHARQLIEFLIIKPGTRPSDLCRTDFAPEWPVEERPADVVTRLNADYLLIHKHLAHLTRERVQPNLPEWKYQAIPNDVMAVANAWTRHVDQAAQVSTRELRAYLLSARQTPMTTSSVIATTTSTSFDTTDVVFPDERSPKG